MERDELSCWLRLYLTPGVGNAGGRRLLAAFGLPCDIFTQSVRALEQVVSQAQATALRTEPPDLQALLQTTWNWLLADPAQRRLLVLGDPAYPVSLLNMDDPPLMLYALGAANAASGAAQTPDSSSCLAIVGSRNPTPQGMANARLFARSLVQAGKTVVSGLALGIDGAAHEGALEGAQDGHLATIAVVGTGLDRVYPRQHHDLAHRITQHGLLLSEFALGTPPSTSNFPRRNRIIAGLSQGTLVVEAALLSGSLITARLASEQGKEVFAIPGSIHATQSRGCHALIKQGAKLVESVQDILEELQWHSQPNTAMGLGSTADTAAGLADTASQDPLLQALGFDPMGLDALQARTGLDTASLQGQLMQLELAGEVARLPGGLFQRLVQA